MTGPAHPWFRPLAPHAGRTYRIDESPFWIGASNEVNLPLFLPGIERRHAALARRADGYWFVPQPSAMAPTVNGRRQTESCILKDGDVIELLPGVGYRFEEEAPSASQPTKRSSQTFSPTQEVKESAHRRRTGWPLARLRRDAAMFWSATVVAATFVVTGGIAVFRSTRESERHRPLSSIDAEYYDALVRESGDHVERGAELLQLGLVDAALREFGQAVQALESSRLQSNPWARPQFDAIRAGIQATYEKNRLVVPRRFLGPRSAVPSGRALMLGARLTPQEFRSAVAKVRQQFRSRFAKDIVITGESTNVHVSLYGTGGAIDVRSRDLTAEQVASLVTSARALGIRVKDFSRDSVVLMQIAATRKAGVPERAATGVHLHLDRFADRRDRWTTSP